MAEGKKQIIVYADWVTLFEGLSDSEAGRLIKHFFRYINDVNPTPPDKVTRIAFEPIKQTLKRDLEKWKRKCKKNTDNAKKRWADMPKHANASQPMPTDAKHADSDSDSDSDNIYINIGIKKFLMRPSELALSEGFLQRTEMTLQTTLSGIDTNILWQQFDKNYTCHDFNDRNHFYDSMKKIGKQILNPGTNGYTLKPGDKGYILPEAKAPKA